MRNTRRNGRSEGVGIEQPDGDHNCPCGGSLGEQFPHCAGHRRPWESSHGAWAGYRVEGESERRAERGAVGLVLCLDARPGTLCVCGQAVKNGAGPAVLGAACLSPGQTRSAWGPRVCTAAGSRRREDGRSRGKAGQCPASRAVKHRQKSNETLRLQPKPGEREGPRIEKPGRGVHLREWMQSRWVVCATRSSPVGDVLQATKNQVWRAEERLRLDCGLRGVGRGVRVEDTAAGTFAKEDHVKRGRTWRRPSLGEHLSALGKQVGDDKAARLPIVLRTLGGEVRSSLGMTFWQGWAAG